VHAASPVRHRRPETGAAVTTPCSAARGSVRTVETFAAERRLGFLGHFRTFPPAVPLPLAPRPTLPATAAASSCPATTWRRPGRAGFKGPAATPAEATPDSTSAVLRALAGYRSPDKPPHPGETETSSRGEGERVSSGPQFLPSASRNWIGSREEGA